MRIAMIGSRGLGSHYGGIERMLDHLCPELAALGHEIDVFSRKGVAFEDRDGIRAIRMPSLGGKHLDNLSRSAVSVMRCMRRYDLVHLHALGPGVLSIATRMLRQPAVVTVHGLDQRRDKWGRVARSCLSTAERTLVRNADAIAVVSNELRRYFVERYDVRTSVIPNGICEAVHRPAGPMLAKFGLQPHRYVLFASRLTPEKGCLDLIEAFNDLRTDMRLVIAGSASSDSYMEELRRRADPGKVVFAGHRNGSQLAELFSNAFLFVLPSYIEGMSMALLEALSYGVPALVSDIAENRAVVPDRDAHFAPRDPAGLRHRLAELIDQPDRVSALARRQERLQQPDWQTVALRYDELYRAATRRSVRHSVQMVDVVGE